jgi:signal transduction histidine kinase
VNELLFESEGLIARVAGDRSEIKILMDQHLWVCETDPVQLQAALINIVLNGRDAMPDGGIFTIETLNIVLADDAVAGCLPGCYVSVSVTDSGRGISGELQCRAFEPYFTTKSSGERTGLGLSMVYSFARQSGGAVTIEGDLGRGTTVTLYLPVSEQRRISAVE